jgi:hypothetical protein
LKTSSWWHPLQSSAQDFIGAIHSDANPEFERRNIHLALRVVGNLMAELGNSELAAIEPRDAGRDLCHQARNSLVAGPQFTTGRVKQLLDEPKEVREFRRRTDVKLDEISITERPTATPFALGICVVLANNGQPVQEPTDYSDVMDIVYKHWVKEECPESAAAASMMNELPSKPGEGKAA